MTSDLVKYREKYLCFRRRDSWAPIPRKPHLEYLKASDVQDANKGSSLALGSVQSFINAVNKPTEQPFVCGLGQGFHCKVSLVRGTKRQGKKVTCITFTKICIM